MKTLVIVSLVAVVVFCRTYPLFKQCDARWANQQLGSSSNTICSAGCLMSSVSMALAGTGYDTDPSRLNAWLTKNGGYVSGDLFVWASVNGFGLTFTGKELFTS